MFLKLVTEYSSRASGIPDFWLAAMPENLPPPPKSREGRRRLLKTEPAEAAPLIPAASGKLTDNGRDDKGAVVLLSQNPSEEISY